MKQFQILAILSLINFNSQAMLHRPATLIRQAHAIKPSICNKQPQGFNLLVSQNFNKRLRTAIQDRDIEMIKKIMRYHWLIKLETLETKDQNGINTFELANQSKSLRVKTLFENYQTTFESYRNNATV